VAKLGKSFKQRREMARMTEKKEPVKAEKPRPKKELPTINSMPGANPNYLPREVLEKMRAPAYILHPWEQRRQPFHDSRPLIKNGRRRVLLRQK
jgi:hypothetical protein